MDQIKQYWESQAEAHGESHWASWGDNLMIDLEIETIGKYIKDGDAVLDIGCANGYSTFRQAETHDLSSIVGIDFAPGMISVAQESGTKRGIQDNVSFMQGDIRALPLEDDGFDVVYTTRVLINLPTWEQQVQGIRECLRVAKRNGVVVLSEGFWEPLVLLNSMRTLVRLPPLVEHDFNRYLKLSRLEGFLAQMGVEYEIVDFSSIYYLGSRFLRELVTDAQSYPGFSNPINKIFYDIERQFSGGGMGIQQAVVIRKSSVV